MNMKAILDYLSALEQNNTREWYHANKQQLKEANQTFEELVHLLNLKVSTFDDSVPVFEAKDLTFKLVRDTRFSSDKSPYNPAFRAHIGPKGKLPIPVGYYIMIRPGNRSFLGGGLFTDMFRDATTMVRDYIVDHGDKWQEIVSSSDFVKSFVVEGGKLKKVPYGYDLDHPQAEYLKYKSWYLEYPIDDDMLLDSHFVDIAASIFEQMQPFNAFLNRALDGFQMPKR